MLRLGRTLGGHSFSFSGGQLAYFNVLKLLSIGLKKLIAQRGKILPLSRKLPLLLLLLFYYIIKLQIEGYKVPVERKSSPNISFGRNDSTVSDSSMFIP